MMPPPPPPQGPLGIRAAAATAFRPSAPLLTQYGSGTSSGPMSLYESLQILVVA